MLQKIKSIIYSKQGTSTLIYTTVILIFLCVLTLAVIVVTQFRSLALDIQNTAETTLEYYITEQAVENYNSIKNGHSYIESFDENDYIKMLAEALGIDENLSGSTATGRSFEIDDLIVYFAADNEMNAMVSFTLTMPLSFFGIAFPSLNTTVTVYGVLESKF